MCRAEKKRKQKDPELAKYGEGNVNMGAGARVCAEGGWGHVGQIATCNLNLRATRTTRKTETEDKIKVRRRKKDGWEMESEGRG